jgi:hypothetical protein
MLENHMVVSRIRILNVMILAMILLLIDISGRVHEDVAAAYASRHLLRRWELEHRCAVAAGLDTAAIAFPSFMLHHFADILTAYAFD